MNTQTRKITEGAMMVALVGLLLFINRQFAGMIETFMYWILTFPILIYTAKYGIKDAMIPAVSMVLLSFMIAAPTTIFYLFSCNLTGMLYGEGVRKKWSNATLLIGTAIITLISYLITTVIFAAMFGYNPQDDIEMVKMVITFLNIDVGVNLTQIVTVVIVGSAILMTILQTMCIHLIANISLKRLKIATNPMKNMFDLEVPQWFGAIIIIIWVLYFARNVLSLNQEVTGTIITAYSITKIFAIAYGALTLSCFLIVFRKQILVFLVFIGIFVPYVQGAIAIIGILDMIVKLRLALKEVLKRGVANGSIRKF